MDKWKKAEMNRCEARDYLHTDEGSESLAENLIRASMTYEPTDKRLADIGRLLGLLHPVQVFSSFTNLAQHGISAIMEKKDDDDKVTVCRAVSEACEVVCKLVKFTQYWNGEEVIKCLRKTATLMDEKRIKDELVGDDDVNEVCFTYDYENGEIAIKESEND